MVIGSWKEVNPQHEQGWQAFPDGNQGDCCLWKACCYTLRLLARNQALFFSKIS